MDEVQQIKDKLAREGCHGMSSTFYEGQTGPTSMMAMLSKACMLPEDMEWLPGTRKYPRPGDDLMINPYPKVKKKKGKKGKKK